MGAAIQYRRDVDGLRAVAVVPVVLFHANIGLFSGGFVGVDIFFVISGFLITQIIASEMQAGTFSVASFYERRIRRIFPALVVVMLLTTALALLLMAPSELKSYGKRMLATLLFMANFKFLKESDYFATEAEVNPLLHMWSLAVEEQFYVVFPLLLLALYRLRWSPVRAVLVMLVGSLALSCVTLEKFPAGTFYLLPTRAWELLLGSFLALAPPAVNRKPWINEAMAWVGIALIGYSIFGFTEDTPFPAYGALPPCVGAALLIASGGTAPTLVSRILSVGPMVQIGLISYSLYLFHWPLIVFTNYVYPTESTFSTPLLLAVVVAVVLSFLSLKLVETPFRKKRFLRERKAIFLSGAASMATLAGVTLVLVVTDGMPGRYGLDSSFYAGVEQIRGVAKEEYRWGDCFFDTTRPYQNSDVSHCVNATAANASLLMGDSHSAHLYPGLNRQMADDQLAFLSAAGCRPLLDGATKKSESCQFVHDYWFKKAIVSRHWHKIILAGQWKARDIEALKATVAWMKPHADHIVLVGPSVEYHGTFPELYAVHGDSGFLPRKMRSDRFELNAAMKAFAQKEGIHYISMTDTICPNGQCVHTTPTGEYLHWDYGHLTLGGSEWVVQHWPKDVAQL